jgi:hypothetical protein
MLNPPGKPKRAFTPSLFNDSTRALAPEIFDNVNSNLYSRRKKTIDGSEGSLIKLKIVKTLPLYVL